MYAETKPTQEEPLVEDFEVDDIGATKELLAWWQVEMEGDTGEEVGLHVHWWVDEPDVVVEAREVYEDEPIGDQVEEQVIDDLRDIASQGDEAKTSVVAKGAKGGQAPHP